MVSIAIIGAGPAGLILGYILQGHIPVYEPETYGPHPDKVLHALLAELGGDLLHAARDSRILEHVHSHYETFFVTNAMPVNILLDVLTIPSEVCLASEASMEPRVAWHLDLKRAVPFVLYDRQPPGGQWSNSCYDDPQARVLSYAEMLSLPGYSFSKFYLQEYGESPPPFYRPERRQVSKYYLKYAQAMNLVPELGHVEVTSCQDEAGKSNGYTVTSSDQIQRHHDMVVLASGTASNSELCTYDRTINTTKPGVLIVGTGVASADAVCWALRQNRPVVHIYKRNDSSGQPCPLRRFPKQLYPEYSQIFEWMQAEKGHDGLYRGVPNGKIIVNDSQVSITVPDEDCGDATAVSAKKGTKVWSDCGLICMRTGRAGSLDYAKEALTGIFQPSQLSHFNKTLLREHPALDLPRLGPKLWAVGSLTGDSLVRYLKGAVVSCAGDILDLATGSGVDCSSAGS